MRILDGHIFFTNEENIFLSRYLSVYLRYCQNENLQSKSFIKLPSIENSVTTDGCRPRIADAISRQAGFSLQASEQEHTHTERSEIRDRNEQRADG